MSKTKYIQLLGDLGAVSYDKSQTLTDEQQQQARVNIGADITTDDEILDMLTQEDMFPVVADSDGAILADESSNILLW